MLTEVKPQPPQESQTPAPPARSAWWVRLVSRLPFALLYPLAEGIAWLATHVVRHRQDVVSENLRKAFPEWDARQLRATIADYHRAFGEMLVEVIKGASLSPQEIQRHVRMVNTGEAQALMAQGQSVLLVAAHQCNWEWMLLALSVGLGYPLDAAYKPLHNGWAEREMKKMRTRFGSRLVPAKELLADIIKRRGVVRAVAMVADQEPTTAEHKHWMRFLNRDTAFYLGPEEIARVTRFPVFFIGLRRTARGYYELEFTPLARKGEQLAAGELTERYAHLVEAQIRAAPAYWPWSHKRWKLKKSVYETRARVAS
jgi:Kdo2-lipid IVA lauroyltransferase/acyltransferase